MGDVTSPESAEVPEQPLKLRPGGQLTDRPIQNLDGKWYNNFGKTEIGEEQARREEAKLQEIRRKMKETPEEKLPEGVPGLDVERLKGIYERCVAKYEGKYPNGLLDINVVLDEGDRAEVEKLIRMAKVAHAGFANGNPDWIKFVELREKMRSTLGTLGEDSRIIEDNSAQTPTKIQADNSSPVIKVPTSIYRLSVWDSKIRGLDGLFDQYNRSNAKGTMASYLGSHIQEVYRFVKTSHSTQ